MCHVGEEIQALQLWIETMVAVFIHRKFSTDARLFTATVGGSRTVEALTVVTTKGRLTMLKPSYCKGRHRTQHLTR